MSLAPGDGFTTLRVGAADQLLGLEVRAADRWVRGSGGYPGIAGEQVETVVRWLAIPPDERT